MSLPPVENGNLDQSASPHELKKLLRQALLEKRAAISTEKRLEWDVAICRHIHAFLDTRRIGSLGIYIPFRNEPDLTPLYAQLDNGGIKLSLPVVLEKKQPMQYLKWQPGDAMEKDAIGISIPINRQIVEPPQVLLVPCLGHSDDRFRLGYGGGYYDRTLAAQPRPLAIGVGYHMLQCEFPLEVFDVPMDHIITENGIR